MNARRTHSHAKHSFFGPSVLDPASADITTCAVHSNTASINLGPGAGERNARTQLLDPRVTLDPPTFICMIVIGWL
ncbi:unnamed protein product [Peniophora sp. CBMAI 1063]|nr:unnamed protein product [Peniophora sp. CBMAI 1063]